MFHNRWVAKTIAGVRRISAASLSAAMVTCGVVEIGSGPALNSPRPSDRPIVEAFRGLGAIKVVTQPGDKGRQASCQWSELFNSAKVKGKTQKGKRLCQTSDKSRCEEEAKEGRNWPGRH